MSSRPLVCAVDVEGAILEAMRLAPQEPLEAERRLEVIRRAALRLGLRSLASSCLAQLRLVVGLRGDWDREVSVLRRLVREDCRAIHLVSLAGALERNGRRRAALHAYRRALAASDLERSGVDVVRMATEGLARTRARQ